MTDAFPSMKKICAADDGNTQVLNFEDATATFDPAKGEHKAVAFLMEGEAGKSSARRKLTRAGG